jgi:integrase
MDNLREDLRSPHRRVALGLIFRLLYGCGMRISEILHLNVDDVDLDAGILRVVDTKFRKDRLIPVSPSLAERLRAYADLCPKSRRSNDLFLNAPHGGPWSHGHIYIIFRQALSACGISHTGRGPRIHDLRHTFACHRLGDWIRSGVDVDVALPVLSTYMGHGSLYHTQRYLHFVADMYPDIVSKLDTRLSHNISRKGGAH